MGESTKYVGGYGIGLSGWLGLAFIVLKLVGVIDWSWWWVLLPIWGPTTLVIFLLVAGFPIYYWWTSRGRS